MPREDSEEGYLFWNQAEYSTKLSELPSYLKQKWSPFFDSYSEKGSVLDDEEVNAQYQSFLQVINVSWTSLFFYDTDLVRILFQKYCSLFLCLSWELKITLG